MADEQLVYVLNIHHKHGIDVHVANTQEVIDGILYAYACQYWDEWDHMEEMPEDESKAIDAYFESTHEREYSNVYRTHIRTEKPEAVRPPKDEE